MQTMLAIAFLYAASYIAIGFLVAGGGKSK